MRSGYLRRSAGLCAVALFVLMTMLIATPAAVAGEEGGSARGEADPIVIIKMDNNFKTARVEPGQSGLVIFTGTIEVSSVNEQEYHQGYNVSLHAISENGFSTTVSPGYIKEIYGIFTFTVSVRVPPATPVDMVDIVSVGGTVGSYSTWVITPIPEEPLTVTVEQYYRFDPKVGTYYIQTQGGLEHFEMTIHNKGNGPDFFELEIDNPEQLVDDDLTVIISPTRQLVEAGRRETVMISVASGDDTENNQLYPISIHVSSLGAEKDGLPLREQVYIYYRLHDPWLGQVGFAGLIAFIILLIVTIVFVVRRRKRKMERSRQAFRGVG